MREEQDPIEPVNITIKLPNGRCVWSIRFTGWQRVTVAGESTVLVGDDDFVPIGSVEVTDTRLKVAWEALGRVQIEAIGFVPERADHVADGNERNLEQLRVLGYVR